MNKKNLKSAAKNVLKKPKINGKGKRCKRGKGKRKGARK